MAIGTGRTENTELDGMMKEVSAQLSKARALLAGAHRLAVKMPLQPADQEKSRGALAEAIGLCVAVTRTAKTNNLYRMLDSALNPSELRHSVERAMTKPTAAKAPLDRRRAAAAPATDPASTGLLLQLDACRRINLEGLRWLAQGPVDSEEHWRGKQLLKIAEQLCVVTALECKLAGRYALADSREEPAAVRKTVATWATQATIRELTEE